MDKSKSPARDTLESEELRLRLDEAEETLEAIRSGEVDAVVVSGPQGEQVFTLADAARPYQVMVEQMNEGALTLSTAGLILYCNARFVDMLGLPMERILGEPFGKFVEPGQRSDLDVFFQTGEAEGARGEFTLKAGKRTLPVEISVRGTELGGTVRLTALVSDISARRRAEETIQMQARQFATLLATTADGFWLHDGEGRFLEVNEAYCRMSGYSRQELLALAVSQIDANESPIQLRKHIHQVARKGFDRFETRHRRKDGSLVDVEISSTFLPEMGQFLVFIHDISGRKQRITKLESYRQNLEEMVNERTAQLKEANTQLQAEIGVRAKAEQTLQASEEQARKRAAELDAVITSLPGAVTIYDRNGRVNRTNKLSDDYLGYTETVSGKPARGKAASLQILDAGGEPLPPAGRPVRKALAGEMVKGEIVQIRRGQEEPLWVSSTAAPIYKDGVLSGAVEILTDISPLKVLEEELRRSEKNYRELVKYAPVGIYQIDFRTRKLTSVNEVVVQQTGYSREELLSMSPFDILDEKSQAVFAERLHRWLAGEKPPENVEYRVIAKDGHEIYAVMNVTFTRDEQGAPLGATVVGYDITERKLLEQQIQDIANKYLLLFDATSDGVWIHDMNGRILEVNEAYCRMSGYDEEELIGSSISLVEALENPAEIGAHIRRLIEAGGHDRFESRHRRKDGSFLDVDITALYLEREGGQIAIFARDITERKRAEAAIQAEKERLTALVNSMTDEVWFADTNGKFTLANPAALREFGVDVSSGLDITTFAASLEVLRPDGSPRPFEETPSIRALQGERVRDQGEIIRIPTSGQYRYREVSATPVRTPAGEIIGSIAVVRDVTERRQAEEMRERLLTQVERQAAELNSILESVPIGLSIADANGKVVRLNSAAERILHLRSPELSPSVASRMEQLAITKEDGTPFKDEEVPTYQAIHGKMVVDLLEVIRRDHQPQYLNVSAAAVRSPDGTLLGAVTSFEDITLRKEAEAALAKSNAKLTEVLASIQDDFYVLDRDWKFVYASRCFTTKVGKEPKDFIGKSIWKMFPKHIGTVLEENFRLSMEKGEIRRFEVGGQYTEAVYSMTSFPSPEGITVLGVDITARKRAEEAAAEARRAAEQRAAELEAIMDSVPVGIMITHDREAMVITGNRAAHELLRVPLDEPNISKSAPDPHDRRSYKLFRNGEETPAEELPMQISASRGRLLRDWDCDIVFGNGDLGHIIVNSTPLFDEKGQTRGAIAALIDISERQKAEAALQQSETRYRQLVEVSPDAIFVNRGGKIDLVNQAALSLFGAESAAQMLGKNPLDFFHPSQHSLINERIKTLFSGGPIPTIELKALRLDGTLRTAEVTSALIMDKDGPAAQVILHDVTERKEREGELKRLNRTLTALSNINQAMVQATDEAGYMNDVCRIVVEDCGHAMAWIGFKQEDEAKSVIPVASAGFEKGYLKTLRITWADTERGRGPSGTAVRTGQVRPCPNMLTDPSFEPWRKEALKRGYASSIALPLIAEGKTFGVLTIYSREPDPFSASEMELLGDLASDLAYGITMIRTRAAHAEAETALRASEARFRSLFDSMSEGFALHEMIYDKQGNPVDYRFLEINSAFEAQTGLKRKDVIGTTFRQLLPDDNPRWLEEYGRVTLTGRPAHFDDYSPNLERHYDIHAYRPAPGQFAAIFSDVTEQKRLEGELQKARQEAERRANELNTVFNSIADGIIVYDADGRAQQANRVAVEILGFDPTSRSSGEIANVLSTRTMDGQLLKLAEAPSSRALSGQTVAGERYKLQTLQKGETIVNTSATPLWEEQRIVGAVTVMQDVTEQYHAEEVQAWLASFPSLNPNPITEADEMGTLLYMNPAIQRLFPDLKARGKEHPWLAGLEPIIEEVQQTPDVAVSREVQIGEAYYLQTFSIVPQNRRVRTYGIEITQRKQAEQALQLAKDELEMRVMERTRELQDANARLDLERQRFDHVLNDLPAYLILLSPDYRVPFANRYFEERFGKAEGRHCYDYLFHRTEPCENCITYKTLKENAPQRWEWTGPDNRNYDIHDFPFTDVDGSRLILEMGIDITERKQAEAELEKYRQHLEELVEERTLELASERTNLRKIFDVVHVGLLLVDAHGNVKQTNDVVRRWTGKSNPHLLDLQPGDALGCLNALTNQAGCGNSPQCAFCKIRQTFESVIQTWEPKHGVEVESTLQLRGRRKSMWLDISADPLEIDGQRHAILALNDVSARKEAEQALQQAHDELEQRVEQRTQELSIANSQLKSEVAERTAAEEELHVSLEEMQVVQEELHSSNDSLRAAQSRLENERQKYQNLFDFAPIMYVTTDTTGTILEANKAARGLLKGPHETIQGLELSQFIDGAGRAAFGDWLNQLQTLDGISGWETSLLLPTGLTRAVSINASRVVDLNEGTADLHWLIADISERKQAEAQLRLQTSAMEAAANGIMITDCDGSIEWCNPAFARVSGYNPEEVLGRNPRFLKSGRQKKAFYKQMWDTLLNGQVWSGEMINRRKDGELYVEEEVITPVRDERGEISHFIAIKQDITARKEAEEALRLANAYNRSLLEANIDGLATVTPDGKIGDVNPAMEKMTGCSRQELIGTDFHSYFSDPVRARLGYQRVFETGSVQDYELEIRRKDGHLTPVLYNGSVYRDQNGKVQGVFAGVRDITDRKRFEAQLMQAEKHAVIGRMVGSVTHEINNPLQTIKNCLYLIRQDTPADSVTAEPLEMATSETARLTDLVGQLRELYRPRTDVQDKPQELLDILEEVHALLTPHLNNSKVKWKPLTGLTRCYINCVRDQILEVFLNVSMNAIEAMQPGGGKLFVDMAFKGEQVGVVFRDTGPGISPDILPRIFEPFMTTKSSGLGLGLSISYGIVQRHGGQIVAENHPDGGAAFTVWLPLGRKGKKKENNPHAAKR